MSDDIKCVVKVERSINGVFKEYYMDDCGRKAKYRIHYNRYYKRPDDGFENIHNDLCKIHLNMYKKSFDKHKTPYRIEDL